MNRNAWRFLFLCFLFVFGLLVGLEAKNNKASEPTESNARDTFINSNHYISRIENGQLVFEPVHQQGVEKPSQNELLHVSDVEHKNEMDQLVQNHDGPKMNKKGKLDQMGQSLGSKFSQLTRATLEMSFSLFTK